MKCKITMAIVACFPLIATAVPPTTQTAYGDRRTFEVHAIAPAFPALKYQLTLDPIQQQPGDAAALYMQAFLQEPVDADKLTDPADLKHDRGKSLANDPVVTDLLQRSSHVFELLELAASREQCDWQIPFRELGTKTRLIYLNNVRSIANLLLIRGDQQIDSGDREGAIGTIRLEYALGNHIRHGGGLIGSLVGIGVASVGNSLVEEVVSMPDSPNLYWPLMRLSDDGIGLKDAIDQDREFMVAAVPVLSKGRTGGITAEDWGQFTRQWFALQADSQPPSALKQTETIAFGITSLPDASKFYSQTRHVSFDEVSKLDPKLVLATYFIEQFQIVSDEYSKLMALPLDEAIRRSQQLPAHLKELGYADTNIISILLPSMTRVPITFGRFQRQVAALAAIQALRAYAAGHGGQLPARLNDVTETPVPANPMTGKLFDYRIDGNTAVLSDETSPGSSGDRSRPLVYKLRILP